MRGRKPQLITPKQSKLLTLIERSDGATLKEVVGKLGLSSNRSVIDMVRLLEKNGHVTRLGKKTMSVRSNRISNFCVPININEVPNDMKKFMSGTHHYGNT